MKTLLKMFAKQGVEAGQFQISFAKGMYDIKIGNFEHSYPAGFDLEYMMEETLSSYLKFKNAEDRK